jgi:molybdopterin synthase catalytic subunit
VATVLYFAAARERSGTAREELKLSGRTVREVVEELVARHPGLGPLVPHLRVAVNQAFAGPNDPVPAGAELALIPPVAGG